MEVKEEMQKYTMDILVELVDGGCGRCWMEGGDGKQGRFSKKRKLFSDGQKIGNFLQPRTITGEV